MNDSTIQTAIQPTRSQNYAEWYLQVIKGADLAEHAPVRGCMVIKPWGYAIWERMQQVLDRRFKETGHVNAYFPLLIPLSFLEKEATHVAGFAKECAVVTHHRLEEREGSLVPAGPLDEPFVIRPTSETLIGDCYSRWVQSYRDLPILMNQWANVMRWEMRTRLFLRTAEFLWQEGHTAHATAQEAQEETNQMIEVYREFAEDFMAMRVIMGEKTPGERFPGAVQTLTIEAMMQDFKALQAGTSHFLGQNFAKASNIQFMDPEGQQQYAWTTSWGVSTRLIGGLIMTHSDDDGLVLPPRLAPVQIRIMPILKNNADPTPVLEAVGALKAQLEALFFKGEPLRVDVDKRPLSGGDKLWQNVKKGIPILVELGPKDLERGQVCLRRRDRAVREKQFCARADFLAGVVAQLEDIQDQLWCRSKNRMAEHTQEVLTLDALKSWCQQMGSDTSGEEGDRALGFAKIPVGATVDLESYLKPLKLSARCIPKDSPVPNKPCALTGEKADHWVLVAKAY